MKKHRRSSDRTARSMFSIWNYLVFFFVIAVIVSISFLVFAYNLDSDFSIDIQRSALLTFVNVLVLSMVFTLIDGVRRRFTVQRPVRRILDATRRLTEGDFSARVEPLYGSESNNEFDAIITNLNKMAEELGSIETLRTDFIANVSHELKTPLAVIQNYSTMLLNPDLPTEERLEHAKTIALAASRLSELITNILKLNKLENQQIFSEAREINLGEQLRECLLSFEDAWDKKELELDLDIDDISIKADPELLAIVWNNLISNAVKFTQPGGMIAVSLKEEKGSAVARISDTGCGMTPEVGRHIFEKFYQGDKSHATQGNGLGLALVKRIMDITGGEVSVESALGEGTTFTVKLSA